jgi:segregation and condensation protein A
MLHARPGGLEDEFAHLLPEVDLTGLADRLAFLAGKALTAKPAPSLPLDHLHIPKVSVAEQAEIVSARLREHGALTFRSLAGDADRLVVVARFLALLELYRRQAVAFEQLSPLGELSVRWLGGQAEPIESEFDEAAGSADESGEDG